MYVGVIHTIRDRDGWTAMLRGFDPAGMPEGIALEATGTATDVSRAICLWRAPSVEVLQETLDRILGGLAANDCFGVSDESITSAVLSRAGAQVAGV